MQKKPRKKQLQRTISESESESDSDVTSVIPNPPNLTSNISVNKPSNVSVNENSSTENVVIGNLDLDVIEGSVVSHKSNFNLFYLLVLAL